VNDVAPGQDLVVLQHGAQGCGSPETAARLVATTPDSGCPGGTRRETLDSVVFGPVRLAQCMRGYPECRTVSTRGFSKPRSLPGLQALRAPGS